MCPVSCHPGELGVPQCAKSLTERMFRRTQPLGVYKGTHESLLRPGSTTTGSWPGLFIKKETGHMFSWQVRVTLCLNNSPVE